MRKKEVRIPLTCRASIVSPFYYSKAWSLLEFLLDYLGHISERCVCVVAAPRT